MARTHGRVYSRFWPDLSTIPGMAQRAYLFLISQSDLSQAGVLPLRLRRWAQLAPDVTPDSLRADLAILERAWYVVVDDDTEEVLVRTYIRNDQVYRQPNVMLRAVEDSKQIASSRIKVVLLQELDRIPLDELSPEVKNGKSQRGAIEGSIAEMRKVLSEGSQAGPGTLPGTLREGFPEPLPEPFANGSGNPSRTPAEGLPEPPTRVRARVAPSPIPRTPVPVSVAASAPTCDQDVLDVEVEDADPPARNPIPVLVGAYVDAYKANGGIPTEAVIKACGKNVKRLVEVDAIEPPVILLAAQRAGAARSKDLDRYLGDAQQRYGQTQSRDAMRAHWYERAAQLDAKRDQQ
jgi:hypothetical protein